MAETDVLVRLEHRLARLERQNRRLRGAVAGAFAVVGLLALAGFTQMQERVVRAQKFELVNAQGQMVSEWELGSNGPILRLGRLYEPHVTVGTFTAGAPSLSVWDGRKVRMILGLDPEVNGTGLHMTGPEPTGQGPTSGVNLVHVPRYGPELVMREAGRTLFTTRPR